MPLRPLKHIVKDIMDHCSKTIGNAVELLKHRELRLNKNNESLFTKQKYTKVLFLQK